MEKHAVSLSTAVQVCRELEDCGVLEARPRSGNYIRQPDTLPRPAPIAVAPALDTRAYVGIHEQVCAVLKASQRASIKVNFASAYCAPELYPLKTLQDNMIKSLRLGPCLLGAAGGACGNSALRSILARRALASRTHLLSLIHI